MTNPPIRVVRDTVFGLPLLDAFLQKQPHSHTWAQSDIDELVQEVF